MLHKEGRCFLAECIELGTVSQGPSAKEALANLKEATALYLEEFPRQPAPDHGLRLRMAILRLRRMSGEKAVLALERLGFVRARRRRNHVVLKKSTAQGEVGCVVPVHGELAIGTLRGVLRQAKVAADEFMDQQ